MKLLGNFLRYFLNINSIWGLMILVAFVLTVAQHYLPTTTVIPGELLSERPAEVTIRVTRPDESITESHFILAAQGGQLAIAAADRTPSEDHPYLIALKPEQDAAGAVHYLLTWDHAEGGTYHVAVGERLVRTGMLVTLGTLTEAAFEYAEIGFDIALGLIAAMVLFLGLMKVGENAGIIQLVARAFHPLIRFLFPGVPRDHPAAGAILMNVTSTLLGLGNAATPFGLKAMKELQTLNPNPRIATDAEVMLLGYNTAGLALLPTTLIAIRKSAGCSDPFEIIGTCMFAGATAAIVAITMVKVLGKLPFFSVEAAVAEQAREQATSGAAPQEEGR